MLRIGKYTSVPKSRVLMFKQVDKNTPFDFQGNAKWCREKAIPSVSSQFLYLSHSNYIPTFLALLLSFSAIYSEAQKSEPSIIMGQEIIDNLEPSCCWRGQKSAQF